MPIPTDSADVRELREVEQARAEVDAEIQQAHADRCVDGWLGEDSDGRPIACIACRPQLLDRPCVVCGLRYRLCAEQQARRRGACCSDCLHSRRDVNEPPCGASTSPASEDHVTSPDRIDGRERVEAFAHRPASAQLNRRPGTRDPGRRVAPPIDQPTAH